MRLKNILRCAATGWALLLVCAGPLSAAAEAGRPFTPGEVWNDTDGYRVVLFVDFERPLRWPFSAINHWLMNLAALAPFLREAKGKQQASEKKFWALFGK